MSGTVYSMNSLPEYPSNTLRWDIFCRVIDNYGDAGVCWRLASDLAQRGEIVRLFIDKPAVLVPLQGNDSMLPGITVNPWPDSARHFSAGEVADVVVEAFACDPPVAYIEAMNARQPKPLWINLEYLSAESWVDDHHGLPSPHPRYALTKYFFFPGFTARTGGLLREPAITAHIQSSSLFKAEAPPGFTEPFRIFMFSYEQPGMQSWLDALVAFKQPVYLGVTACPAKRHISDWASKHQHTGHVRFENLAFVAQNEFDALLETYDFLFVRGEDSFVRAQWAGKPLVWHIYPQADRIHFDKLLAFYDRYLDQDILNQTQRTAYRDFVLAWNGASTPGSDLATNWQKLVEVYPLLIKNALKWRSDLLKQKDLVSQLKDFARHLVK